VSKPASSETPQFSSRFLLGFLATLTLITAGLMSWFASSRPDGLEWSIERVAGNAQVAPSNSTVHTELSALQRATSYFKGYSLNAMSNQTAVPVHSSNGAGPIEAADSWPTVDVGTSAAGIIGGTVTFCLILGLGYWLTRREARSS
jgi:cobalt/nickel transport system permease protein